MLTQEELERRIKPYKVTIAEMRSWGIEEDDEIYYEDDELDNDQLESLKEMREQIQKKVLESDPFHPFRMITKVGEEEKSGRITYENMAKLIYYRALHDKAFAKIMYGDRKIRLWSGAYVQSLCNEAMRKLKAEYGVTEETEPDNSW
ncbi:MAG: hypothetical protein KatS3mg104_3040 [Phycisphaerae bacterium]|nr:MAG: hypothetical protein KatS3mg104_3040 [Phycisphaerae bacterium]